MPRRPLPSAPKDHDATNQNAMRFSVAQMLREVRARLEEMERSLNA